MELEDLLKGVLLYIGLILTIICLAGLLDRVAQKTEERLIFLEQQLENLPDSVKIEYYKIK